MFSCLLSLPVFSDGSNGWFRFMLDGQLNTMYRYVCTLFCNLSSTALEYLLLHFAQYFWFFKFVSFPYVVFLWSLDHILLAVGAQKLVLIMLRRVVNFWTKLRRLEILYHQEACLIRYLACRE